VYGAILSLSYTASDTMKGTATRCHVTTKYSSSSSLSTDGHGHLIVKTLQPMNRKKEGR
jgi:hypothetical protein